ncbi:hypothetical protein P170DRAFT_510281 [Aspergillus steynii IBT 23096]|uniref:Uncharacterized protein n=1 Tax=Aspergillus steynii IBT 23096 TaxID=1392250 RepID=A0A2I2GAD9_9EURO|nr:uncharacterized protein P170DRAFT_510281 [Aspergillus steynii IBT 23096]PLB49839.1 hypothetical protein P170DRAFT_510281 [Aspergillus steynii IBT 23096]
MAERFQFPTFRGVASTAAEWLEDAGVPAVLFWNGMKTAYTGEQAPSSPPEIQFVVPDHLLDMAADALVRAGFKLCTRVNTCRLAAPQGQGPLPDEHFHNPSDPREMLILLEQSNFLWAVPEFPLGPVKFDDPCFMNSDDSRLEASQRHLYANDDFPYRILTPGCLLESLLHLAARDRGASWTYQRCWIRELDWILFKYVKGGKPIRECQVTPLVWPFVCRFLQIEERKNFTKEVDRVLESLRQELYDKDAVAPLPGVVGSVLLGG